MSVAQSRQAIDVTEGAWLSSQHSEKQPLALGT